MQFSVLAYFVCGFAVLDEFFFGFAVSSIPQCPPKKYDDASKDAFYQVEELMAPVNSSFGIT